MLIELASQSLQFRRADVAFFARILNRLASQSQPSDSHSEGFA